MIFILLYDEIHPKWMNWDIWKLPKCSWNSFDGPTILRMIFQLQRYQISHVNGWLRYDFPTPEVQYISCKWMAKVWFSNRRGMNPYNMVYVNIPQLMIFTLLYDEIHPKWMNWGLWKWPKCSWNSFDRSPALEDDFPTAKVQNISLKWMTRVWFSNRRGTKYLM
jgi:hypothetical protein